MSMLQQALGDVGYKPTPPKTPISFSKAIDGVMETMTRKPRIQVQRAGSCYKARWAGHPDFCFGVDPEHAVRRLRGHEKLPSR